jgi:hypothetical protein
LHFARSTNIDSRFKVDASTLAWQASSTSSGKAFQITKLASMRPLAEQYPASRAWFRPRPTTSCVN